MNNVKSENLIEKDKLYKQNLKELEKLNLQLNQIRKSANKNLIFWLLIPLFGIFIYYAIKQKRVCDEEYLLKITECKVKISKLEIENIKLLSKIEAIQNENN